MEERYLSKLHSEILTIMDEVDRVCRENGIRYYLIGGTLLGAVRHKGFIPWDDDLDIVMPRDDMERFISLAPNMLKPDYRLEWITTNHNYWQIFAKVTKKGTIFKEQGFEKITPIGIFVDIFPLDYSPKYGFWLELKRSWTRFLISSIRIKNQGIRDFKHIPHRIIGTIMSNEKIHNRIISVLKSAKRHGATHFANFGSQYSLFKQTMPIEWYGDGIPILFEGREYVAPTEYHKVLNSIFGSNYMTLPPKEKRRCHYPEKVVFSDGEIMLFDKPSHIVTIEEQQKN